MKHEQTGKPTIPKEWKVEMMNIVKKNERKRPITNNNYRKYRNK